MTNVFIGSASQWSYLRNFYSTTVLHNIFTQICLIKLLCRS